VSHLLVVGAPSGAGKTTLRSLMIERADRLRFAVSHTTRAARAGEVDGRDYHFIARAEFESAVAANEFLESAEVYGNLYGTHRSEIRRAEKDDLDLLLDVDLQGARSLRAAHVVAAFVLVLPPSWHELETRLRARGTDSEATIARRLELARQQLDDVDAYDYVVVNDDAERAAAELLSILAAERARLASRRDIVDRLLDRGSL